jgi:hypothetical protein
MIAPCECKNPFQDKEHGRGMRVWNETKEHGRRCTGCGKQHGGTGGKKK